jgi:hypothetical protein
MPPAIADPRADPLIPYGSPFCSLNALIDAHVCPFRSSYEASELPFPFVCPLTHILDIFRLRLIRPASHRSAHLTLDYRESSFLTNPLTPRTVLQRDITVHVVPDVTAAAASAAAGQTMIPVGASDKQVAAALSAHVDAPLLTFTSTEGVFGGWVDGGRASRFEDLMRRSSIASGSWCCSSWYKPSGTVNYARPPKTRTLPTGCGIPAASATAARPSMSSVWGASTDPRCVSFEDERRRSQAPFFFTYELAPGPDGYWRLRGQPEE